MPFALSCDGIRDQGDDAEQRVGKSEEQGDPQADDDGERGGDRRRRSARPLAGGLEMAVPFLGSIYTTNITPDPETRSRIVDYLGHSLGSNRRSRLVARHSGAIWVAAPVTHEESIAVRGSTLSDPRLVGSDKPLRQPRQLATAVMEAQDEFHEGHDRGRRHHGLADEALDPYAQMMAGADEPEDFEWLLAEES